MLCAPVVAIAVFVPTVTLAQRPSRTSTQGDSVVVLDTIRVTVARADQRLATLPYAISVATRDEIQRGRVTAGLDEALATIPGVVVANRYNLSLDQRLSIRGFGARSAFGVRGVKVLLDGVPQTLPDGQGQLTNIDLANVTRIEVLKGSSSALYGNASGGVVSVWTDGARPERFRPLARLAAGSYRLFKWVASAGAPVGAAGSLAVSASRTTTDGFRDHSAADQRQLHASLTQPVGDRTSPRFYARIADSPTLDNPGALTAEQLSMDPAAADARNVNADAGKAVTQAQGAFSIASNLPRGATASATFFGLTRDLENPLAFAYIQLDRRAYGVRALSSIPITVGSGNHSLTAGFDAQWQRDDRVNFNPDRTARTLDQLERVVELGPFVQGTIGISPRITLTVGSRHDRVRFEAADRFFEDDSDDSGERVMSAWSATVGLTYRLHAGFQPYANAGTSFETPTTTELVNRPDGEGGFNLDLDPQHASNYELGVRGDIRSVARYSFAAFYSDVRDQLIPFEVPNVPNRTFFRNAGSARHLGAELEIAVRPTQATTVHVAYTYANHEFQDFRTAGDVLDGNEIPGVPRHYGHLSLRYRSPGGFWAALDNTYSSSYYADDQNTTEVEWWTTTGIRVGFDRNMGTWQIAPFLGILNLFDRNYVSSVVVNARGGRYFEPAPPRNVYLGLSVGGN